MKRKIFMALILSCQYWQLPAAASALPISTPDTNIRTITSCHVRCVSDEYIGLSDGVTADMPTMLIKDSSIKLIQKMVSALNLQNLKRVTLSG